MVKYNPDQPRVPAGNSDGGQWTAAGGGGSIDGTRSAARTSDGIRVAGRLDAVVKLLKLLSRSKPQKLPDFLVKRPTAGKIAGKIEDLTPHERTFAEELKDLGHEVEIVPRGAGRTPDVRINGKSYELKTVDGVKSTDADGLSDAISNRILNARGQAADVIVDARKQAGMTREAAERAVRRAYGADSRRGIESITILTPDGPVFAPRR